MKKRKTLIILISILSVIFILSIIFIIDYSRYLNNKKPIFVISTKENTINNTTYTLYNGILYKVIEYKSLYGKNYMEFTNIFKKVDVVELTLEEYNFIKDYFNEEIPENDSRCFNVVSIYDVKSPNKKYIKEVSLWVKSSCYYVEQRKINETKGYSIPYKLTLNSKEDLKIDNVMSPRDESYYTKDMKKIFEKKVRLAMDNTNFKEINSNIKHQVEEYFYPLKLD